jgi:hypothetical protein
VPRPRSRSRSRSAFPQAPDLCAPIVGWRAWAVALGPRGARLLSPLHDAEWEPGRPLAAACRAGGGHEAVHDACGCGVHAARDPATAAGYLVGRDAPLVVHRVLGRVALWGLVAEAEHGWRGAFAYPRELLVPTLRADRSIVDAAELGRLLAVYGVPVRALPGRGRDLLESPQ